MTSDFGWCASQALEADPHPARRGRGFRFEQRPGDLKVMKPIRVAIPRCLRLLPGAWSLRPAQTPAARWRRTLRKDQAKSLPARAIRTFPARSLSES